jgi:hypothetical protein
MENALNIITMHNTNQHMSQHPNISPLTQVTEEINVGMTYHNATIDC